MSFPVPFPRLTRLTRLTGLGAVAVLAAATALVATGGGAPQPAAAAVVHHTGLAGTVLGWTSWYGSYHLGDLGEAWCLDHGLSAPDPDLGYVPIDVTDASANAQAAVAWITAHSTDGSVDSAARMLAVHDLMGASYPMGTINVDTMNVGHLAGFGGHEAAILSRAREIKADALAHAHLRGPHELSLELGEAEIGDEGELSVQLRDANGAPLVGYDVALSMTGADLGAASLTTGGDGSASTSFEVTELEVTASASATVPSSQLAAYGSSTSPAQRAAVGQHESLTVDASFELPPPTTTTTTTTTTTSTTTTTTAPEPEPEPTTTITTTEPEREPEPTTTTTEPETTTTTEAPEPTTTTEPEPEPTTTEPEPTTTEPAPTTTEPPGEVLAAGASLPRTGGGRTTGFVLLGVGLVLLGLSVSGANRRAAARTS